MKARIAHISDPHFGTTSPLKEDALIKSLQSFQPDLVALSGDLTQRARGEQFVEARNFIEKLSPFPVSLVPGNHDIPLFNLPARVFTPYRGIEKILQRPINSWWKKESLEVLGLNTTHRKRHIQGELYPRENKFLNTFSAQAALRIVMFHHPMDCPKEHDEKNLLIGRQETASLLKKHHVDLVLSGHIHDSLARLSSVRYPQTSERPFIISVAGTCLSSRTRTDVPNTYNQIEIDSDQSESRIKITRLDLQNAEFFKFSSETFIRGADQIWKTTSA